ncbi:MAG: hypothetical protein WBK25_08325 [Candidatus Microthrix parvicella]
MSPPPTPELLSRSRLDGIPWSARATRGLSGALMAAGVTLLPWMGPSITPGAGITYAARFPVLAVCALACALVVFSGSLRPDPPPTSPLDPPVPRSKSVSLAALAAAGLVLGTNLIAELLAALSVGRTALEALDGAPVRLLPGPGQLLFGASAMAALLSGAGRPPVLTFKSWLSRGPLGTVRGWIVLGGIAIVALSRGDTWLQAANFTVTGAEIPVLGQLLGTLILGLVVTALWTMTRGGATPRLLGGIFGISLLILAGATLLISGFVVRLVPTDALELRAAEFAPSGLGDQLVGQTADGLRGAGAGNGPILAIIGVALLTVGAAFPSLRRNRTQQQPAHAGEQASAPPPPPPSPPPPQPPSPPSAGTPPPPPATWWETSEGLDR